MGYEFDWSAVFYPKVWIAAIGVTLAYAVSTTLIGLLIGMIVGVIGLSRKWYLKAPVVAFVQFFRCTPLMVQIIWFYYALPILTGHNLSSWFAAGLGLTLYMSAFSAEIFRGGVISIERGQWNAARALGMSYPQMLWNIILPQATRRMIPPFVNQSVMHVKNTSLLYVVAVPDIMYSGYDLTSKTYRPLETYTFVALLYFFILLPLTLIAGRLETTFKS